MQQSVRNLDYPSHQELPLIRYSFRNQDVGISNTFKNERDKISIYCNLLVLEKLSMAKELGSRV